LLDIDATAGNPHAQNPLTRRNDARRHTRAGAGSGREQAATANATHQCGCGPFRLDAYAGVSEEDRAKVRDLLRALRLLAPDADLATIEGKTVTPPPAGVTDTPNLFVTHMSDLMSSDLSAAAEAAGKASDTGPACTFTCDTIGGLAQGFCVASFKGETAALCLAASSAASESCTAGCPQ
jgi:hypothetical protein